MMLTALDELRWSARDTHTHRWLTAMVRDVSPQQALWRPAGRANTIAATYAHIVRNQDEDMNHGFLAAAMLSEGEWRGRTGMPEGWSDSDKSEWSPDAAFDWLKLRAYGEAVGLYVIDAVDRLSGADLQNVASLSTPDHLVWTGLDVVRLTVGRHPVMHGGEIACLKGLQDLKGYVTGLDEHAE